MPSELHFLGKALITIGGLIVAVGLVLLFSDKLPFLGRLPGDIHIKKDGYSFYFPIVTSLVLSLVISALLWLFRK